LVVKPATHGCSRAGTGSWRRTAFFVDQKSHQLLRMCGAEKSSVEAVTRTPLSKQRNKHLQSVLIEAAK
jgi:hypothetical protein